MLECICYSVAHAHYKQFCRLSVFFILCLGGLGFSERNIGVSLAILSTFMALTQVLFVHKVHYLDIYIKLVYAHLLAFVYLVGKEVWFFTGMSWVL